MFLNQARGIIWGDIIQHIRFVWDHMVVIAKEKSMIKASKFIIHINKDQE